MVRMNREVKEMWLNRLRDSRTRQCLHGLHRVNYCGIPNSHAYCVMGVLADIYVSEHDMAKWDGADMIDSYGSRSAAVLTKHAACWAGLYSGGEVGRSGGFLPFTDRNNRAITLIMLNDAELMPFEQLADVIEYFF